METKEILDLLERQNRKLSILYEIALTVSKSLNLKKTLGEVLDKIIDFMAADAGVVYVIDEDTLEMIPVVFRNLSEEVVKDLTENRVKVGECVCGTIAQLDREVIIYQKASQDERFTRESLRKEEMEFYFGLPLKAKDKVVGVLCVITHEPYEPNPEMLDILRAAVVPIGLAIDNARLFEDLKKELDERQRYINFEGILTESPRMKEILAVIKKVLDVPTSILIQGESGTGKELIARAIHYNSIRRDKPFIAINCAAVPETLLESELFGYVRGAFTGATTDKKGLLESADQGTILLDEIDSMSLSLQAKLLRFLQDGVFYKLGSTTPKYVDVRIIAATNQDIEQAIQQRRFREDLYYRLNVVKIEVPPLRERKEDIPLLVRYFIHKYSKRLKKTVHRISDEALNLLLRYHWPGNIRELENTVQRAIIMADSEEITPKDLPPVMQPSESKDSCLSLQSIEKEHIMRVLSLTGGNKKRAAELLGIDPSTLWRKIRRYHIC